MLLSILSILHSMGAHNAAPSQFSVLSVFLSFAHRPMSLYLVIIAWLYVTLMMAVAEATNTNGTVLGAIFTFLLYGVLPLSLVVYLMSTPARRRALKEKEAAAQEAARRAAADKAAAAAASATPDAGGETPADPVAPVREKP